MASGSNDRGRDAYVESQPGVQSRTTSRRGHLIDMAGTLCNFYPLKSLPTFTQALRVFLARALPSLKIHAQIFRGTTSFVFQKPRTALQRKSNSEKEEEGPQGFKTLFKSQNASTFTQDAPQDFNPSRFTASASRPLKIRLKPSKPLKLSRLQALNPQRASRRSSLQDRQDFKPPQIVQNTSDIQDFKTVQAPNPQDASIFLLSILKTSSPLRLFKIPQASRRLKLFKPSILNAPQALEHQDAQDLNASISQALKPPQVKTLKTSILNSTSTRLKFFKPFKTPQAVSSLQLASKPKLGGEGEPRREVANIVGPREGACVVGEAASVTDETKGRGGVRLDCKQAAESEAGGAEGAEEFETVAAVPGACEEVV
ncbi:hypothetical protein C8R45DRAFT_938955 [Mycena sanguinolenta]|nr:hypothetical protein C8R45DRAFT_938955 [Mycena sanguinolenta]